MGLRDFEIFLQERITAWDENADVSSGSPLDTQVIQPVLRRIGTDPFTMDAAAFIFDRLSQEHPEIAIGAGDATTDLLVKMMLMLWDPIIRETKRVAAMQSFKDPYVLTTVEAEALGANLFSERSKGAYSKGVGRIYYSQPQSVAITQSNFFSTRAGLRFFPRQIQSIRREEMLLNLEGELYYFDVNLIAEKPGSVYNIGAGELTTAANLPGSAKITNKARFKDGLPEENAVDFVAHIARDLTERSLVTLRGIVAKLAAALPEITRLQVIGFNDPEMGRDIVSGGGLGKILGNGMDAEAAPDLEYKALTRRIRVPGFDFTSIIGPVGPVNGYILTLAAAYSTAPHIRDLAITYIIDTETLELGEQIVLPTAAALPWTVRKWELTLSGIPGGILFPDSPDGTVTIESDKIHIGGCTDTYTRAGTFDSTYLVIDSAVDEDPLLMGFGADPQLAGKIQLTDYQLGVNYAVGDDVYNMLELAAERQYTLRILEGNNEGNYRILHMLQTALAYPQMVVDPAPPSTALTDTARWRILDELEMDLVDPRETRISATDGSTIQNSTIFTTASLVDFDALGVSVGDTLRILSKTGDEGDFEVQGLIAPFTQLQVDRPFKFSRAGVSYTIFRPNTAGGVIRPLIRITSIDLLDTSGQPVGVSVPYAKPVDIQSRAFSNAGRGVRVELTEAVLGLVTMKGDFAFGGGGVLIVRWNNEYGGWPSVTVPLAGNMTAQDVANAINIAAAPITGYDIAVVLQFNSDDYVGFVVPGANMQVADTSTLAVVQVLFGASVTDLTNAPPRSSHIRAFHDPDDPANPVPDWGTKALDEDLDVVYVVDGTQEGFYDGPRVNTGLPWALQVDHDFAPSLNRVVRVGSRSIGTARVYFLQPTSFEVNQETVFSTLNDEGIRLNYKPDPTLGYQKFPSLPGGTQPKDGQTHTMGTPTTGRFTSVSQDFLKLGVQPGDELAITFTVLRGTLVALADPVVGLAGKNIILSINNSQNKTITFLGDLGNPTDVSREGVANQINAWIGQEICAIVEFPSGSGDHYLTFDAEVRIVVRANTSPASGNALLGFPILNDSDNDAADAGAYVVTGLLPATPDTIEIEALDGLPTWAGTDQQYIITRPRSQRIGSTSMEANEAEAGLYYFDVELVSEGTGDLWNITRGLTMVSRGYLSDGFYLTTEDTNLSLSPAEDITLHLSRSIIEVGADDDPSNATQISGQALNISYDYSSSVQSNQSFQMSDAERVINQSPLARHLIPHLVRFDVTYVGGSKENVVLPLIEKYISELAPDEALESSDVQKVLTDKNATSITNPIDLIAVVYDLDREVYVHRSQDALTTGRLAAFIPDVINLTRRTT